MSHAQETLPPVPVSDIPQFAEPGKTTTRFYIPFRLAQRLLKESFERQRKVWAEEEQQLQMELACMAAEKTVAPVRVKSRPKMSGHETQVFDIKETDSAWENTWKNRDGATQARAWFDAAKANGGLRKVPRLKGSELRRLCDVLSRQFPNFADALSVLESELMLAMNSPAKSFRLSPLLLHGTPGIGKTAFAQALAKALNIPCEVVSAGGLQGGFDLCGGSSHWGNAAPGKIFKLLANNTNAVAILVLDEIDKVSQNGQYPIIPSLLDLLEVESAKQYMDECVGFRFDASKLIVVATANELERIYPALVSRLNVVEIADPTFEERRQITVTIFNAFKQTGKQKVLLTADAVDCISRSGKDVRDIQRILRAALGQALVRQKKSIGAEDIPARSESQSTSFGFIQE